jgi:hypothetical protein
MADMIGICDSVERDGRTYVVQTEDKGLPAGSIETAVFEGGRVVHVRRASYQALLGTPGFAVEKARMMENQHREVREDVGRGRLGGPPARGEHDR